jgi:hypothetical protein
MSKSKPGSGDEPNRHGVSAKTWFSTIETATNMLSRADWREKNGIERVTGQTQCSDPSCKAINRRQSNNIAMYRLTRDIEPVVGGDYLNEAENKIAASHPWQRGAFLCRPCAIAATAKRMIEIIRIAETGNVLASGSALR